MAWDVMYRLQHPTASTVTMLPVEARTLSGQVLSQQSRFRWMLAESRPWLR